MQMQLDVNIWWREDNPHEIYMASNDPTFTDETGQRPGVWVTWSSNPRSANYSPPNFNRFARALKAAGEPAPDEVPLHPRELRYRARVIEQLGFDPIR